MVQRVLPPLKALRAFEAAARHANFTAAAEELHITHSAVSQQIRLLEEFLGQPMFVREARGVQLLPHAMVYFQEVQACLDRLESATQTLKSPGARRVLRVCTTPSLAMKWLIPRLAEFHARTPGVEVQLSTQSRQRIERADASNDVVIRRAPMQRADHTCVRCLDDFLIPVASPGYIQRHRLRQPSDCLGHPLLQVSSSMDAWPRWFGMAGVEVPAQLPGPVFEHQFLCLQAAMNDLGLAMAPWCLLEDDIRADRLRPLFLSPRLQGEGVYAMYRTDNPVAAQARVLVQWLSGLGHDSALDTGMPGDARVTQTSSVSLESNIWTKKVNVR